MKAHDELNLSELINTKCIVLVDLSNVDPGHELRLLGSLLAKGLGAAIASREEKGTNEE
jgi:hypothetical protein